MWEVVRKYSVTQQETTFLFVSYKKLDTPLFLFLTASRGPDHLYITWDAFASSKGEEVSLYTPPV